MPLTLALHLCNFRGFSSGLGEVLVNKRFIVPGLSDAGTTSMERAQKHLTEPVTLENCKKGEDLVGRIYVNQSSITWEKLKEELKFIKPGGYFSPPDCTPTVKAAIIIPYRDRDAHLKVFLRQIHPMLRRQKIFFQIFVIEQADENRFNRGKLMNVGFAEALKRLNFSCFIFHDVDLIPEDDRNFYGCHLSPAHMSVAVDKFKYELIYQTLFGGVVMFTKSDFEKVNGFSNAFWGWGAEDDNLYQRLGQNGLVMKRPAIEKARYTMIKHSEAPKSDERFKTLKEAVSHTQKDGLNSLEYRVTDSYEHDLYTKISVNLLRNAPSDSA
eukprot:gene15733-7028_t